MGKDNPDGFAKALHGIVGCHSQNLAIAPIDKNRAATGGVTAVDVPPAIANHPTAPEIQVEQGGSLEHHRGFGFAAFAGLTVICAAVVADLDKFDLGDLFAQAGVNAFDHHPFLRAAADVRLVCDDHERKTGGTELCTAGGDPVEEGKLVHRGRRIGFAVADYATVKRAVSIKEYRGGSGRHAVKKGGDSDTERSPEKTSPKAGGAFHFFAVTLSHLV